MRTEDEGGREAAGDNGGDGRAASRGDGNTLHEHFVRDRYGGEGRCVEVESSVQQMEVPRDL
jgi:hypothetical protein